MIMNLMAMLALLKGVGTTRRDYTTLETTELFSNLTIAMTTDIIMPRILMSGVFRSNRSMTALRVGSR